MVLKRLAKRYTYIVRHADTSYTEVFVSGILGLMSLGLLNPRTNKYWQAPTFDALRATGVEKWQFGLVYLLAATLMFWALYKGYPGYRAVTNTIAGAVMMFFAVTLFISNPVGTGWAVYGAVALSAWGAAIHQGTPSGVKNE